MAETERGSDILAYTCTYGDRKFLPRNFHKVRATAGTWFDWAVFAGAPSAALRTDLQSLLDDPERRGIQMIWSWPENRGQHHATAGALELARKRHYKWLLRLDDDVQPKTKEWLRKMVDRLVALREATGDRNYRLVAAPRIVGLQNLLQPVGKMEDIKVGFPVEVMNVLGGACRLHNVQFLANYEPPLLDPLGRGDPNSISTYVNDRGGMCVRFPDIRVAHFTKRIEDEDTDEQAHTRKMGYYWPYLGAT